MDDKPPVPVSRGELAIAVEMASSTFELVDVLVSRRDGRVIVRGGDFGDEDIDPDTDLGDEALFVYVPNKRDLDLGQALVFDFVREQLPDDSDAVRAMFRRPGAYRLYKDHLERRGKLQQWYDFEEGAFDRALAEWAAEEGFVLVDLPRSGRSTPLRP